MGTFLTFAAAATVLGNCTRACRASRCLQVLGPVGPSPADRRPRTQSLPATAGRASLAGVEFTRSIILAGVHACLPRQSVSIFSVLQRSQSALNLMDSDTGSRTSHPPAYVVRTEYTSSCHQQEVEFKQKPDSSLGPV